jgi:uncharacterized protein
VLTMKRFRPNFIFAGGVAYEEDTWQEFLIGSVKFKGVKPCGRCMIITIDPLTAEQGKEPMKTLATYRTREGKVKFGQNVIALEGGSVSVGDSILLIAK